MAFDDYEDFLNFTETLDLKDVIFGVKKEIIPNTLYISLSEPKTVGSDDFKFTIGYIFDLVLSATDVDTSVVSELSDYMVEGFSYQTWDESSRLYVYSGRIYIPDGGDVRPWQN
ncbi:hypothetical protein [Lactococcus fujiensis]|uniref:hypothetical protein n=1 Tax=Lactococcus fujiensis TaxID=610251 RepID=UPI0006D1B99B|nr:hypothetical protein [Lactococcus fujiensis]